MDSNTIVVTGGVGYVGRAVVQELTAREGVTVHVLDSLACGEHRLERMARDRFVLHRCDLRDRQQTREILHHLAPSAVIHLAAIHYIPDCDRDPPNAVGVNVAGTVHVLDALAPGCRFVFASTAAVYKPQETAHTEGDENLGPIDVYGYTKLHGEHLVKCYQAAGKVDAVVVRLFNVVGPGETNPHLVPAIVRQIGRGGTRLELGNLFPHRDYIDVEDAASGFVRLARLPPRAERVPEFVNLGTGRTHSVREVIDNIAAVSGMQIEVAQDPSRIRSVDRPMLKASTQRLEKLIAWRPQKTLHESMRSVWDARFVDRLV